MPRQDPYPAYLVAIPCLEAALVLVPFIVVDSPNRGQETRTHLIVTFTVITVIVGLARGEVCL